MSTTAEQAFRMLHDLRSTTPDIEASAVVSHEGFIIASLLPADVEEDRMAAISTAMLTLGVKTSADLRKGALHEVFIRSEDGCVAVTKAGDEAVLGVLTRRNAQPCLLFMEMKRAAAQIGVLLSQSQEPS
jgi:predicted regulator of Ras-like GTPase activity (Roadblock/LC7/MglB family)